MLTLGHQQVDIVAADEVVGQADDGALQAGLAMVVRCVCRHKARQLRHLHPTITILHSFLHLLRAVLLCIGICTVYYREQIGRACKRVWGPAGC